ncbi:hypothetical protein HAX54_033048, partial [Datura stramonium]|nr:hypothetical protein [Datura stramonium]
GPAAVVRALLRRTRRLFSTSSWWDSDHYYGLPPLQWSPEQPISSALSPFPSRNDIWVVTPSIDGPSSEEKVHPSNRRLRTSSSGFLESLAGPRRLNMKAIYQKL